MQYEAASPQRTPLWKELFGRSGTLIRWRLLHIHVYWVDVVITWNAYPWVLGVDLQMWSL